MFFEKCKPKFLEDLKYLKDETLYKILWASFKANSIVISENNLEWISVKTTLIEKAKDLSPKTLCDLLLLSTKEKHVNYDDPDEKESGNDFFGSVESEIILKMKMMSLDDLINVLWSALEIERGSPFFYETLENELSGRIRGIKDEQFETLISCFAKDYDIRQDAAKSAH